MKSIVKIAEAAIEKARTGFDEHAPISQEAWDRLKAAPKVIKKGSAMGKTEVNPADFICYAGDRNAPCRAYEVSGTDGFCRWCNKVRSEHD